MKTMAALLAIVAGWGVEARAVQDKPAGETREVRIFLLDRTHPERTLKDASASLTLERKSGRGETLLFPIETKLPSVPDESVAPGLIRGLISTPYFVLLDLGEPPGARRGEEARKPEADHEAEKAAAASAADAPLSSQDVLRRARKGTWFSRKMPASAFSVPFTATVTIRLGALTYTTEEFQGPRSPHESPQELASRVDRSLERLQTRAAESASFMDLKPLAGELRRDLSKLAPAGFEDAGGEVERDRQWCLGLARAIDNACDLGNSGAMQQLCLEFKPRMKDLHARLGPPTPKEAEPVPTPETPPTVK
jgi:hypothetical protein